MGAGNGCSGFLPAVIAALCRPHPLRFTAYLGKHWGSPVSITADSEGFSRNTNQICWQQGAKPACAQAENRWQFPGLWGACWHKPGAEQDPSLQGHAAVTGAGGTLSRAVKVLRDYFLSLLTFQKLKHFQQKKSLEERDLFRQGNRGKAICQWEIIWVIGPVVETTWWGMLVLISVTLLPVAAVQPGQLNNSPMK